MTVPFYEIFSAVPCICLAGLETVFVNWLGWPEIDFLHQNFDALLCKNKNSQIGYSYHSRLAMDGACTGTI